MLSPWLTYKRALTLTYRHLGKLLLANLLWVCLSIPLLTLPPATMGLYYLAHRVCSNPSVELETTWKDFFKGFKDYFLDGYKLITTLLLTGSLLTIVFAFYSRQASDFLRALSLPTLILLLAWMLIQLYILPIYFEQENKSTITTFRNGYALAFGNLNYSISMLFLLLITSIVAVILAGPILFIFFSFIAITQTCAVTTLVPEMPKE